MEEVVAAHSLEAPGLLGRFLRAEVALGNPALLLGQLNAQAFPSFPSCSQSSLPFPILLGTKA